MKRNKRELDAMIDDAARGIRDERIDPTIMDDSATRVWARVSQEAVENSYSVTSHLEGINTMNPSNNA